MIEEDAHNEKKFPRKGNGGEDKKKAMEAGSQKHPRITHTLSASNVMRRALQKPMPEAEG
jgi:hypothetical protein